MQISIATPDSSPVALLIIDTINDLEFPRGAAMLPRAVRRARAAVHRSDGGTNRFARAPRACDWGSKHYVNENFGRRRSDFYNTTLDPLLEHLQTRAVIITGNRDRFLRVVHRWQRVHARSPRHRAERLRHGPNASCPSESVAHMRTVLKATVVQSTSIDRGSLGRSPGHE